MTKHKTLIIIGTLIIIIILGYVIGTDLTQKFNYEHNKQTVSYFVQSGDTLWGIAEKYKPHWMDTREYIHEISKLNDMDSDTIHTGDELIIYTINIKEAN